MFIYPIPQKIEIKQGFFELPSSFYMLFDYKRDGRMYKTAEYFAARYKLQTGYECRLIPDCPGELDISVRLLRKKGLKKEEYTVTVGENGISIYFTDNEAAFRAVTTLLQMLASCGGKIPYMDIEDCPSVERRGYMLDISRDRVPKLETILKRIDLIADLKYNELQMYIEQPVVEYSYYPQFAKDIEALTQAELLKITDYAKERFIEVVPNHNSFGHSHLWLIKPELKDCQVLDNGYAFDPTNEKTYEHYNKVYDSLLSCFDSDFFNVGCDEVSELDAVGSKTKEICDRDGTIANIYLSHLLKLHDLITSRGKRMMIWADIILHHPETVEKLPKDIIPLVWGYCRDSDLETGSALLEKEGFDFYVCPGTSAWACITGFIPDALQNIANAVKACTDHHGKGVLITDWGDIGSAAFPFISMRQIAFGGCRMWNKESDHDTTLSAKYFDDVLFKAQNVSFAALTEKLGECNFPFASCSEYLLSFLWEADDTSCCERITRQMLDEVFPKLDALEKDVENMRLGIDDARKYNEQFISSIKTLRLCAKLYGLRHDIKDSGTIPDFEARISAIETGVREAKVLFRRLWAEENKITGWYGFWWFFDRQINRYKQWYYKDDRYSLIINDNKELGI